MSEVDVDHRALEAPDRSLAAVVARRVTGHAPVDAWGLDVDLVDALRALPGLGAAVAVEGAGRLPDGPALLLHPRLPLGAGVLALAVGVSTAADRPVRLTGVPDVAPLVGVARRLGAIGGHPADVRGLLLAGHLVAVALTGDDDVALGGEAVAAAVAVGAPLVPVSVRPALPLRRARLRIDEPVPTRRRGRARPLDDVAEDVRSRLAVPVATGDVPRA